MRTKKLLKFDAVRLGREARLALLTAVLIALAAVCFGAGADHMAVALAATAIAIVAAFYFLVARPAKIPVGAVLSIRIADDIREDGARSPIEQLRSRGQPTLNQLRRALEGAAHDEKLAGVIVEVSAPGIGLGTARELHDLLRAVVAANKRVVAVVAGDGMTPRDYLIACGAGEIVANPDTSLMMLGAAAGGLFLRDALARAGVQAQTLQWKEYKGAAEMFSRDSMSPELRESLKAIVTDWKKMIAASVAATRGIDPAGAHELLGRGFISARTALSEKLIDRVGHLEDVRAEFDPDGQGGPFVNLARYLRHLWYRKPPGRAAQIALIHGLGPVITGDGALGGEFLSGERVAEEFRKAAADDDIRAIVFRINSPGGSAVGSDLVWRAVGEARRRGKPVVASMGDVAASGGYYVAMGADAIVAEPETLTGSIGVVYAKFSLQALLRRLGVGADFVKTDEIGDALSVARPLSDTELAQLNAVMGELYENFTAKVAEGRKLELANAEKVAKGRVWTGGAAKERGLVDELGGLGAAIALARQKADIAENEPYELVRMPGPGLLATISLSLARADGAYMTKNIGEMLGMPSTWAPAMLKLAARGGMMLLCPLF